MPGETGPRIESYRRYRQALAAGGAAPPRAPRRLAIAAILCATLVILGSWGPWLRIDARLAPVDTLRGLETNGTLTLYAAVVAIVALSVVLVRPALGLAAWVALGALGLCALVGAGNWLDMSTLRDGYQALYPGAEARLGWGVVTVALAGAAGSLFAVQIVRHLGDC